VVGTEKPLLGVVFDVPACRRSGQPVRDAGQAQGSTGPETLETASWQRGRLEEQGLGVPVLRASGGGKDEKARRAVNAKVQRWAGAVTPARLPAEEKLRRAEGRVGNSSFVAGGNDANPRAGSALQHARRVREEKTVEVVGNHVHGTRGEMASRSRRRRGSASARLRRREWTLGQCRRRRGVLWKSQERKIRS